MSYSVQSGETSSSVSTVSSASASFYSREKPSHLQKKWWYAANWSAAFCDSVEERFTCGEDKWANEFDYEEDETTAADTITVIEEVPPEAVVEKKVVDKKKNKPKTKVVVETETKAAVTKSQSLFAEYHNSKTNKQEENTEQKKEKEILNQFIQGNHRGWGRSTTTPQTRKKKTAHDFAKGGNSSFLVSDGSTTFDDTVADSETCDDTSDNKTLEYASTSDSTFDGSNESSYPDDEDEDAQSYSEDDHENYRLPKSSPPSMKIVGHYSDASSVSSHNRSGRSGRTSRVSDASRNDTARNSFRDAGDHRRTPDPFERQSPSFESRGSSRQHQYHHNHSQQQQQVLKAKHNRSFETQPTVSSGYSSSQGSTMAKSSFVVTPQKMLSTYQSSSKTSPSKTSTSVPKKTKAKSSNTNNNSLTMNMAQGMDKKIALGKSRAKTRMMIQEQAKSKPKAFPYMVNHSLFHQNLETKKARAMARQTGRVVGGGRGEF